MPERLIIVICLYPLDSSAFQSEHAILFIALKFVCIDGHLYDCVTRGVFCPLPLYPPQCLLEFLFCAAREIDLIVDIARHCRAEFSSRVVSVGGDSILSGVGD